MCTWCAFVDFEASYRVLLTTEPRCLTCWRLLSFEVIVRRGVSCYVFMKFEGLSVAHLGWRYPLLRAYGSERGSRCRLNDEEFHDYLAACLHREGCLGRRALISSKSCTYLTNYGKYGAGIMRCMPQNFGTVIQSLIWWMREVKINEVQFYEKFCRQYFRWKDIANDWLTFDMCTCR